MYSTSKSTVQSTQNWSKIQHSVLYVYLYCTCNVKRNIKQGVYMLQKKIISFHFLNYTRKLNAMYIFNNFLTFFW